MTKMWADEAVSILISGLEAKLSARDISKNLTEAGYSYTREAVLGKANRLGINTKQPIPEKRHRGVKAPNLSAWTDDRKSRASVPMDRLTACTCRWPVESGLYCGRVNEDNTYCKRHVARAYGRTLQTMEYMMRYA